jgi:hypothetical protein
MPRHIAWSATVLVAATAVVIALDWPHSLAQSPVVQPAPGTSVLEQPTDPIPSVGARSPQGDSPRHEAKTRTSPHDSPETIYAEFVAACAEKNGARAIACLAPEWQASTTGFIVAETLDLEFDAPSAEPLRKALGTHGLDPTTMPTSWLRKRKDWAGSEESTNEWKEQIAPRIRNIPALIADLEPILKDAAKRNIACAQWALHFATFSGQTYGFLRELKTSGDSATASARTQQHVTIRVSEGMPPTLWNRPPTTVWTTITFQSINDKWYLAKFDVDFAAVSPESIQPANVPPIEPLPIAPPPADVPPPR